MRFAPAAAALALAALAGERPAGAQQSGGGSTRLINSTAAATPRSSPLLDPWERRVRFVSMNAGALAGRATSENAPATAAPLVIDLFDGAAITAVFDRFDPNDTGVTWVGHVPDRPGSLVTIVQGGGVMAASIILPEASYTIRPVPRDLDTTVASLAGVHVLTEINRDGFQPEADPLIPELSPEAFEGLAATTMADSADFVDVLIVYTSLAENWAGGPAGMLNWLNLGMSETNSAYEASGVSHRVRLVHAERVGYTEVGNFSTNLNNLRAGAPGLQTVAELRNAYTADLVSLFVRPVGASACGIAFLMTSVTASFASNGFSVLDAPCSSPNGTLAHEFGHNMGLRHDWYMDAGVTPFTYAHGYVNATGRFRTIMSYPNACTSLGITCARILAFSNPEMTHLGQPLGVAGGTSTSCPTGNASNMSCDADERRAMNNTALTVANFREFSPLRPPLIRTHPQDQSVPRGQPITLHVAVDGLGPFSYQWYRGAAPLTGSPLPGATGPVHTFVPGADGVWFERWLYWVQVSNAIGSVSSFTATITMLQPGASAGEPQRRIAPFATGDAPGARPGSVGRAQSRARTTTPAQTSAAGLSHQPGPLLPPARRPLPEGGDLEDLCKIAHREAALALSALSAWPGDPVAVPASLARLIRAVSMVDDLACRGARPAGR